MKISDAPSLLVPAQTSMVSSEGTGHFEAVVEGRPVMVADGTLFEIDGSSGVGDGVTIGMVLSGDSGGVVKPHGPRIPAEAIVE